MEHDDFTRMLKFVRFISTNDGLYHVKFLFSSGKELMALEEMIPRSSRLLFQTGSIASSSRTPPLILTIKITADSPVTRAGGYSVRLNLTGTAQRM